jgi:hypothetical protein
MKHNRHVVPKAGISVDMDASKKQADRTEPESTAETKLDTAIGAIQKQANHVGPVLEEILTAHHGNKV